MPESTYMVLRFLKGLFAKNSPFQVVFHPVTEGDMENKKEFVTSGTCNSIEKDFSNRCALLMQDATDRNKTELQRLIAIGQMEVLKDVLLEWRNLRMDLQEEKSDHAY